MVSTNWHLVRNIVVTTVVLLALTHSAAVVAAPGVPDAGSPAQDGITVQQAGDVVIIDLPQAAAQAVWTPQRMATAAPMPLIDGTARPTGQTLPQRAQDIAEHVSQPSGGGPDATVVDVPQAVTTPDYDYPPPFTSYEEWGKIKKYPLRTIGKLFFRQNGVDYVCSGAVAYDNVVWTAGHCLSDGSGNSTGTSGNLTFVPAYKDGSGKYGAWTGATLVISSGWYYNGDISFDYGAIIMNEQNGVDIGDAVGWLGFKTGEEPVQHWAAYGYPAAPPFNGQRMWVCQASFATEDTSFSSPSPIGIGCDMTGGSSGGPWILYHNKDGGYINGNNSYKYLGMPISQPLQMYSPYYGAVAWDVFCFATGNEPGGCP